MSFWPAVTHKTLHYSNYNIINASVRILLGYNAYISAAQNNDILFTVQRGN